MKRLHDLSLLEWTVEGYTPYVWLFERVHGVGFGGKAKCLDVPPVPARVPGSVQGALREAGILPDWNIGLNARQCEWVEHRHWMYRTRIPDAWLREGSRFRLECQGLDYSGWVHLNGREIGAFRGTHLPHAFDITDSLVDTENVLEIIFDLPPRWLGQFGYTSQMREWKTRFNYTWDWVPRIVQTGIWDGITLVAVEGIELRNWRCAADTGVASGTGILEVGGGVAGRGTGENGTVRVELKDGNTTIRSEELTVAQWERGIRWTDLPVKLWWPNLEGEQPLYAVTVRLVDGSGIEHDALSCRVGFRHVEWTACEGAPADADPWLCSVNGRGVFLQGVNFSPLCATYADLTQDDYRKRLLQYREMGLNLFRINGCQFLERRWFYDLADEMGLMVWQEFPLTSSGLENWPPEDDASIGEMAAIAASFIERRRHHASLILWSGGNELMGDLAGRKTGMGKPCDRGHPMLARLQEVVRTNDPGRRFIPTSPSGPRAGADPRDFGKGIHGDVHGGAATGSREEAERYWAADDALFRSEVYCSGSSSAALIKKYAGGLVAFPANEESPYWARLTAWWIDWHKLIAIRGREPRDLEEYVSWSQEHQATMLGREMESVKDRFPRCGGVLMWSGHDTYPLTINSSLIDFDGNLKPVAATVSAVWRTPSSAQRRDRR